MSVAAAIRRMLANGLSVEQALLAAESFETEQSALRKRTPGAEASARYRQRRKASSRDMTRHDGMTGHDASSRDMTDATPSSSSSEPREEKKEPSLRSGHASARGSRLAADWQPSEADRAYARKRNWPDDLIEAEAEKFRNHFHGATNAHGGLKADWAATWRKWVGNADQRPPVRAGPGQRNGGANGTRGQHGGTLADGIEVARRLTEQLRGGGDLFAGRSGGSGDVSARPVPAIGHRKP